MPEQKEERENREREERGRGGVKLQYLSYVYFETSLWETTFQAVP